MRRITIDVPLPHGAVEGEFERRGDRVRVRLRLVDAAGFVTRAFRRTFDSTRPGNEPIPREFTARPEVRRAVFDASQEIWRHRVDALTMPGPR